MVSARSANRRPEGNLVGGTKGAAEILGKLRISVAATLTEHLGTLLCNLGVSVPDHLGVHKNVTPYYPEEGFI